MSIVYKCRHCRHLVGKLEQTNSQATHLGWHALSNKEKQEMIHYLDNGDIQIQTICESCQDSLHHHPQYHELDYFIQ